MQENEIRAKSHTTLNEAISYLEGIVASLKEGRVCVEHGEESLTFEPKGNVTVQVKARKKQDKESVSLKITWRPETNEDEGSNPPLKISSRPPAE